MASCMGSVQLPKMLMCPQGQVGENLEFTGQQSLNEELCFFYLCLEGDTGASQSVLLSSFQCSVGTNPQAAAHPAFLARGSFQQLYNMSAKRKQEGKGKWSYEVKTKKIKIPGSCSVAMAAGGGNSFFGESAA